MVPILRVIYLKVMRKAHEVHDLPDIKEPVLHWVNSIDNILSDNSCEMISHKLWRVVPVAQASAQLVLHVGQVLNMGPGLAVVLHRPLIIGVVHSQPVYAVIYKVILFQVSGNGDRAKTLSHFLGKLLVSHILSEQNIKVGLEPFCHLSLSNKLILL